MRNGDWQLSKKLGGGSWGEKFGVRVAVWKCPHRMVRVVSRGSRASVQAAKQLNVVFSIVVGSPDKIVVL